MVATVKNCWESKKYRIKLVKYIEDIKNNIPTNTSLAWLWVPADL